MVEEFVREQRDGKSRKEDIYYFMKIITHKEKLMNKYLTVRLYYYVLHKKKSYLFCSLINSLAISGRQLLKEINSM